MLFDSTQYWHCKVCNQTLKGKSSGFDKVSAHIMATKNLNIHIKEHIDSNVHKEAIRERRNYKEEIVAYING